MIIIAWARTTELHDREAKEKAIREALNFTGEDIRIRNMTISERLSLHQDGTVPQITVIRWPVRLDGEVIQNKVFEALQSVESTR